MIKFLENFIKKNWKEFTSGLHAELPKNPREISLLEICGTSKARSKVLFLVFEKDNKTPILVIKFHRDRKFDYELKNEYENLQKVHERINGTIAETVPRPIYFGLVNGLNILIESGISGFRMKPGKEAAETHLRLAIDWLIDFHKATLFYDDWTDQTVNNCVRLPMNQYRKFFTITQYEKQLFTRILKEFEMLKGENVPIVTQHGDFWSHNIFLSNQAIRVIDWADSSISYVPSLDIFHFPLWYGFELTKRGIAADLEEKVNASENTYFLKNWFSDLVYKYQKRYFAEFKVDMRIARLLFVTYLLHKSNQDYEYFLQDFQSGCLNTPVTVNGKKASSNNCGLYRNILMKIAKDNQVYGEIA